ncbi:MAG: segregation and condensation protein [Methanothermococcus sp.]|uniref:hypothetical protein n=1 Tax=Methanothermococcus TaxID=155862 RepID=UPI0003754689|nr:MULTISPECIES: hypothetical protein [Methanothermococcus]MDK2791034.1 segregation and condensation protein [Methanothermococcus sp.]MDK2988410.1 segregation and condensation protein [Methanothermococcus sp.]
MIGITKMYYEIADLAGIDSYKIVNPYNESCNCDILIISKGYAQKVKKLNPNSKIIEIKSATFLDLIESLENLKELKVGNPEKIDKSISYLKEKDLEIKLKSQNLKKKISNINIKVRTSSEFIKKIVEDLGFPISNDVSYVSSKVGQDFMVVEVIPDYMVDMVEDKLNEIESSTTIIQKKHDINNTIVVLKTHNYQLKLVDRIEDRYLSILHSMSELV